MLVKIKFIDNGKNVVLSGCFEEVTEYERVQKNMLVRTLWFDVEAEYGCQYEVCVCKLNNPIFEWRVSHAFHWLSGADCYSWEISSHDTSFDITLC